MSLTEQEKEQLRSLQEKEQLMLFEEERKVSIKACEELQEYAKHLNDEAGEICQLLVQAYSYRSYVSKEFHSALVKEITGQLEYFKKHFRIVEERETVVVANRYLEEIYDDEEEE